MPISHKPHNHSITLNYTASALVSIWIVKPWFKQTKQKIMRLQVHPIFYSESEETEHRVWLDIET